MKKLYQKELDIIWKLINKEPLSSKRKEVLLNITQIIETYALVAENLVTEEKKDIGDFHPTYSAYFNFGFCANDQFRKLREMTRDFRERRAEYERHKNNEKYGD